MKIIPLVLQAFHNLAPPFPTFNTLTNPYSKIVSQSEVSSFLPCANISCQVLLQISSLLRSVPQFFTSFFPALEFVEPTLREESMMSERPDHEQL